MVLKQEEILGIEIAIEKRQEHNYKLLTVVTPKIDGYRVFKYNKITKELTLATFRHSDTYVIGGNNNPILDIEKDCVYVEAINTKNAIKHLKNGNFLYS